MVDTKGDCSNMRSIYMIRCQKCSEDVPMDPKSDFRQPGAVQSHHYIGLTATSVHNRMLAHQQGYKAKSPVNVLH